MRLPPAGRPRPEEGPGGPKNRRLRRALVARLQGRACAVLLFVARGRAALLLLVGRDFRGRDAGDESGEVWGLRLGNAGEIEA